MPCRVNLTLVIVIQRCLRNAVIRTELSSRQSAPLELQNKPVCLCAAPAKPADLRLAHPSSRSCSAIKWKCAWFLGRVPKDTLVCKSRVAGTHLRILGVYD